MASRLSQRTQILLAIIAAASAILVALVTNWPFSKDKSPPATGTTPQVTACADGTTSVTTGTDSTVVTCAAAGGDINVNAPASKDKAK